MFRNLLAGTLLAALAVTAAAAAETTTYKIVDKIAGPDGGGWDLTSVDANARRLYVSRPYGVMAVDLDTGKVTAKFIAGGGVHGILPIGDTGTIISANEDTNSAIIFDGKTGKELAIIKVGNHPDSVTFDPKSGLAVVINQDGGDATLVDVKAQKVVGTIPIGGQRLEFSVTDGNGLVYVNIDGVDKVEDKSEIAVLGRHPEGRSSHRPSGLRPPLRPRL
jgi:DNA-binding beta-propeller fold protein YncE